MTRDGSGTGGKATTAHERGSFMSVGGREEGKGMGWSGGRGSPHHAWNGRARRGPRGGPNLSKDRKRRRGSRRAGLSLTRDATQRLDAAAAAGDWPECRIPSCQPRQPFPPSLRLGTLVWPSARACLVPWTLETLPESRFSTAQPSVRLSAKLSKGTLRFRGESDVLISSDLLIDNDTSAHRF